MQDRQFWLCHCIPFNRFVSSDSDPDMMFQQGMNSSKVIKLVKKAVS